MLNADEIFAEVSKTRAYLPTLPVDRESLLRYALASEYNSQTKSFFESGEISVLTTACWRCDSSLNTLKRAALHLSPKTRQLGSHLMFWQRARRL